MNDLMSLYQDYEAKFMMKVEDIKGSMQRIKKQLTKSAMWLMLESASKSRVRQQLLLQNLKLSLWKTWSSEDRRTGGQEDKRTGEQSDKRSRE